MFLLEKPPVTGIFTRIPSGMSTGGLTSNGKGTISISKAVHRAVNACRSVLPH